MIKLAQYDTVTFLKYMNRAALLDPRDYRYPLALGNYYSVRNTKSDAIYYYKNALFNYANLHSLHAMISPKWYGYKTSPNNVLPIGLLENISPVFEKKGVYDKLIGLYKSIGQDKEAGLIEKYSNGKISVSVLFNEINKIRKL